MPMGPTDWQKRNQDILKDAFNKAQEEQRGKKAQKTIEDRRTAGSQMIKKQSLSPNGPTPPRSTRHQVTRGTYNREFAAEKAKESEEIKKATAMAEDARKRAASKPPPGKNLNQAAAQQKSNQQQQGAANHKMYEAINKAKSEITSKQPNVMVKSDFNKSSGGREGR